MKKPIYYRLHFLNQDVCISIRTSSSYLYNMLRKSSKYFKTGKAATNKKIRFGFVLNELPCAKGHIIEEYFDKSEYLRGHYARILKVSVKGNMVKGWIVPPPLPESLELLYFLPLTYLLEQKGIFQMHAAALAYKNKGILIAGRHLCGKSILALKLLYSNFKFLSEEYTYLRSKGISMEVLTFGNGGIGIISENWNLFSDKRRPEPLFSHNKKIFLNPNCIGKTALNTEARVLCFPQYKNCKHASILPMHRKEAMKRLILDKENFKLYSDSTSDIYKLKFFTFSKLCNTTKAYTLFYSDSNLDEVPGLMMDVIKI